MATNPFDQQQPIPGVKKIIAVASGKGGVGKSTVATNLALALREYGNVGLLDADIYGPSLPRMMGALNQKPTVSEGNKITPVTRYGIKMMSIGFLVEESAAIVWRGPMLFKAMDQFFKDVQWGELDYLVIDLPPGTGDVQLSLVQKVPVNYAVIVTTPQNIALIDAKKAIDMFERTGVRIAGVIENMSYMLNPATGEKIQLFPRGEIT
jgi:ATP-binding protein involved in chromosome partitioning